MGMFDYVVDVPEQKCLVCNSELSGWQSKDGPCDLEDISFKSVGNFYTACDNCGTWTEFVLSPPKCSQVTIADYTRL